MEQLATTGCGVENLEERKEGSGLQELRYNDKGQNYVISSYLFSSLNPQRKPVNHIVLMLS